MDAKPGPVAPDDDETTLAEEEWPVAEHYRVEPATHVERQGDEHVDDATIVAPAAAVSAQPSQAAAGRRRFPLDLEQWQLGALIAVVLLIAAAAMAAWLMTNGDEDGAAASQATNTGSTVEQPAPAPPTPGPTPTPSSGKTVPEVVGLTLVTARPLLQDAGLRVRVRRVTSERATGTILEQSPAAGEKQSPSGVVLLTVAGAPKQVAVPEVLGLPASEATNVLREAGLQPEIRTVRSTEEAGTVVGQVPAADEKVDRDAVVRLEIATGSQTPQPTTPAQPTPPPKVEIPSLVGLTSADARSSLRELGLRSMVTLVESERPEGTVIGQSPRAGAEIREGGTVTLRVSTGPAPVTVPDVVGVDEQTARQQLEDAGFIVETVDEPTSDPAEDGVVLGQTPSAGTERAAGTVVTLRIARSG